MSTNEKNEAAGPNAPTGLLRFISNVLRNFTLDKCGIGAD
jgi:hypothetical protein